MELCPSLIFDELSRKYNNVEIAYGPKLKGLPDEFVFPMPTFYTGEKTFERNRVYVIDAVQRDSVLPTVNPCLIISNGKLPANFGGNCISIVVEGGFSLADLYNSVIQIFMKYSNWDSELKNILRNQDSPEKYLIASREIFDNPIHIQDCNYKFIACVNMSMYPEKYQYIFKNGKLPEELISYDDGNAAKTTKTKDILLVRTPHIDANFMMRSLFDVGALVGFVYMADQNRKFKKYDFVLYQHLCSYIELGLAYYDMSGDGVSLMKKMLIDLINNDYDPGEIEHLKNLLLIYDTPKNNCFCLLRISAADSGYSGKHIIYKMEKEVPELLIVENGGDLFGLLYGTSASDWDSVLGRLDALSSSLSLMIGCSDRFDDLELMSYYVKEAAYCLSFYSEKVNLRFFRDHVLEYIIHMGCREIPGDILRAECVSALRERDVGASVPYCDSLRIYLDNNMNINAAAKALYIQRNTFIARLERIKKYIDLDMNDPSDRLYLELSLRM